VAYPGLVDDDDVGRRGVVPNALAETGQDVLGISGFDASATPGALPRVTAMPLACSTAWSSFALLARVE